MNIRTINLTIEHKHNIIYMPDGETIKELMSLKESCSSLQIDGKGLPFEKSINGVAPKTEERRTIDNTVLAIKRAVEKSVRPDELSEVYPKVYSYPRLLCGGLVNDRTVVVQATTVA